MELNQVLHIVIYIQIFVTVYDAMPFIFVFYWALEKWQNLGSCVKNINLRSNCKIFHKKEVHVVAVYFANVYLPFPKEDETIVNREVERESDWGR